MILLFASFAWLAIPTLVGSMIDSQPRASRLVRRNVLAAGGTFLFLVLAGLAAGYGWAGAAYSGLVENFGEGWEQTIGSSVAAVRDRAALRDSRPAGPTRDSASRSIAR